MRKIEYNRKRYCVFVCYHCRQWQYCNMYQKTHTCINCGKKLALVRVNPALETSDINEAILFIQEVKRRIGLRKGWGQFVTADKLLEKPKSSTNKARSKEH